MNIEMIDKCKNIATKAHEGQFRKFNRDEKYIEHPIRVAGIVERLWDKKFYNLDDNDLEMMICAALLHDTLEDTWVNKEYLKEQGISDGVIDLVDNYLTRQKGQNYFDFIMNIQRNILARCIKLADLEDNMSDLQEGSLKDKYRFAHYVLEFI